MFIKGFTNEFFKQFTKENVIKEKEISWAKEMLDYGAQVLSRDNVDEIFTDIPYLTSKFEDAF